MNITTLDHQEQLVDVDPAEFTVKVTDEELNALSSTVARVSAGVYRVTFTPVAQGSHRLAIKVGGVHLHGSPWTAHATKQDTTVRVLKRSHTFRFIRLFRLFRFFVLLWSICCRVLLSLLDHSGVLLQTRSCAILSFVCLISVVALFHSLSFFCLFTLSFPPTSPAHSLSLTPRSPPPPPSVCL